MTALDSPSNTPSPSGGKITVGDLLSRSLSSTFGNLGTAFSLAVMPLLILLTGIVGGSILLAGSFAELGSQGTTVAPELSTTQSLGMLVFYLLGLAVNILFFVAWTRFVLKGERGLLCSSLHRWRKPHWITLGKGILLLLLLFGITLGLNLIFAVVMGLGNMLDLPGLMIAVGILGGIVVVVAMLTIMLRFSYVLPAAAIGHPYSFAQSWLDTRGQGLRLLATAILLTMILVALQLVLVIGISLIGGLFALLFGSTVSLADPQSMIALVTSGGFMLVIIPLYFFFLALSFVLQTPMINMLAHGFKTGSGWINDQDIAERFS